MTVETAARTRSHNFVLPPKALIGGATYTFILEAQHNGGTVGSSAVTYVAAAPPTDGNLIVFPKKGQEIVSRFRLTTRNWNTDDPPLTYSFYAKTEEGERTTLKTPTESMVAVKIILPLGDITCSVKAEVTRGSRVSTDGQGGRRDLATSTRDIAV